MIAFALKLAKLLPASTSQLLDCGKQQLQKMLELQVSHVTKSGKTIAAKQPPMDEVPCRAKCKPKCGGRVSATERTEIFDHYHLMDQKSRNNYLFQSITLYSPSLMLWFSQAQKDVILLLSCGWS